MYMVIISDVIVAIIHGDILSDGEVDISGTGKLIHYGQNDGPAIERQTTGEYIGIFDPDNFISFNRKFSNYDQYLNNRPMLLNSSVNIQAREVILWAASQNGADGEVGRKFEQEFGNYIFPVALDGDGDGVADEDDIFPNDSDEWADRDDDGIGDNTDDFPDDSTNGERRR